MTLFLAVLFLFSAVLVLQSAAALFLPRPAFLRISTLLQTVLFAAMLATFFFEPAVITPDSLALQSQAAHVAWFPPYCFAALFFQMQGALPLTIRPVAIHGWFLLAASVLGAALCSAALYAKLLSRIASTPDIVQRSSALRGSSGMGASLENAILLFVGRAFVRNKQQKLIAAFYLGLGSAILFAVLEMSNTEANLVRFHSRISLRFLVSTIVAMTVVVTGFRASFAFPVSLRANWVFRLHQVQAASVYLRATHRALVVFTVIPVCVVSAICGLIWEPAGASMEHVALLGLYGTLVADLCLYGNSKLPYTCSYLPGTAQLPFLFWGGVLLFIPMTDAWARTEQQILYTVPAAVRFFVLLTSCVCLGFPRTTSGEPRLCFPLRRRGDWFEVGHFRLAGCSIAERPGGGRGGA
jgi:hypothetical protein